MCLRTKLLVVYIGLPAILFISGGFIALHLVNRSVEFNVESNFRNGTRGIINLVETTAKGSIKNYLRAVAERNLEIANAIHNKKLAGEFTELESRKRIRETILSQRIGENGYIYCVNSKGVATVHQNSEVEGNSWSKFEFVHEQIKVKTGYLEYQWKNPDEIAERPKALYMVYFEPYDWIISVTTYRDEFKKLLPMEEIRKSVKELKFGVNGYAFLSDSRGDVLIHPELEGKNLFELGEQDTQFFEKVVQEGFDQIIYWVQDSDNDRPRKKVALYGYIPEYQWIIGATGYMDEIYAPVLAARKSVILFIAIAVLLSTLITIFISNSITRRLNHLMRVITQGDQGNFMVRARPGYSDEIGKLARIYNSFLEKLQSYHEKLDAEIELHRNTAESLRTSDERLRLALDSVREAVWDWRVDTGTVYFSSRWYTMLGYEPYELPQSIETWEKLLHPEDRGNAAQEELMYLKSGEPFELEYRMKTKDGQWKWILSRGKTVQKDGQGNGIRMLGTHMDITERRKMEGQIQQSQRMESIGNLAGGIAHDFNNLLFPIVGMSDLMLQDLPKDSPEYENVQVIFKAAMRGSDLVNQILAFSRQAEHKKLPVRIQNVLKEVLRLSRATIPSNIEITKKIRNDCGLVVADPTQVHQIAMNLITNAYHAVEKAGGKITIALEETVYHPNDNDGLSLSVDRYAVMTVSDTGHGIHPADQKKIFDPYFTTKEQGKGTGLGLAVVYGIVKEHGGDIKVVSELGTGTTFTVYFPLMEKGIETNQVEVLAEKEFGTERILLVDDEESIVTLEKQILERFGYRVTTRVNSLEALEAFKAQPSNFDLVITDMNMPYLTGAQFAKALLSLRPDIPIVLCTGFSERIDEEKAEAIGIKGFLMKPIVVSDFARMVRNVLDENKRLDDENIQTPL